MDIGGLLNKSTEEGDKEQEGSGSLSDIPPNPLSTPMQPVRHQMEVIVKTLSQNTYSIETAEEDTLLDLKQKIAVAEGTPAEMQRVVIGGKVAPVPQALFLVGCFDLHPHLVFMT